MDFVHKIHGIFRRVTKQYCTENDFPDEFWEHATPEELEEFISVSLNPQLFFDIILMEIRGETIKYSTEKKRNRLAEQQFLLHETERLEFEFHQNPGNETILEDFNTKKNRASSVRDTWSKTGKEHRF